MRDPCEPTNRLPIRLTNDRLEAWVAAGPGRTVTGSIRRGEWQIELIIGAERWQDGFRRIRLRDRTKTLGLGADRILTMFADALDRRTQVANASEMVGDPDVGN